MTYTLKEALEKYGRPTSWYPNDELKGKEIDELMKVRKAFITDFEDGKKNITDKEKERIRRGNEMSGHGKYGEQLQYLNEIITGRKDEIIYQQGEEIQELKKEIEELKKSQEATEKVNEASWSRIDELEKRFEERELIAQIEQPPKYNE